MRWDNRFKELVSLLGFWHIGRTTGSGTRYAMLIFIWERLKRRIVKSMHQVRFNAAGAAERRPHVATHHGASQ